MPDAKPSVLRIGRVLVLAVALFLPAFTVAYATRIEVSADQTTTVIGDFDSLADLLAELCAQADVELRAFDAPDHAVIVNQTNRPLTKVVERILSQENYLLGVREGAERRDPVRLAWIRVVAAKSPQAGETPGGIAFPSRLNPRVAGDETAGDGMAAERAVVDKMLSDDTRIDLFLNLEPGVLAESLDQYPNIEEVLRNARADQQNPAVVEQLDAVIDAIAARRGAGGD